jgi:hypothetical protein
MKTVYRVAAVNNQGASTSLDSDFSSISKAVSSARNKLGPGWKVTVFRIDRDEKGKAIDTTDIKNLVIR